MHTLSLKGANMWEIEIICSRKNSTYIAFLRENLSETLATLEGVSVVYAGTDTISLSIGCKKEHKAKCRAHLKLALADLFCEQIKFAFLSDNIDSLFGDESYRFALAKVCTYFDNDLDKQIVMQNLELNSKKFNIESFFYFRLGMLRQKWLELCNITTSNSSAIIKSGNFNELVRFLLSNIETRSQSVILEMQEKCIIYHDLRKDFDIITTIDPNDKFLVLGKLIELNPSLIKVYPDKENAETINLLKNIFDDKIILN